ncbi:MAG: 3-oxoacyl-ACP reductase FabG [Gammaproteobacteria bacterium]|nr:3-oxoacyl-ACP reductase FabG [Gammaproteobacteria bacterium]
MTHKALVTGGSGGIGGAIAEQLAADGMQVWIHYRNNTDRAQQVADRISAHGGTASITGFDVTDPEQSRQVLETLLASEGVIDVVVHNAGITADAPFPGMGKDQWQDVIDTSLHGFFHVTQPLIMPMIRQRWGRIVSISSIAALHGNRGQTNYAAAKAGLIGATRSLAKEVASRGICANVVAPGFVDTGMIKDIPTNLIKEIVPMKRAGSTAEIAAVVAFLCSNAASYITGEVVNVSGGII